MERVVCESCSPLDLFMKSVLKIIKRGIGCPLQKLSEEAGSSLALSAAVFSLENPPLRPLSPPQTFTLYFALAKNLIKHMNLGPSEIRGLEMSLDRN